MPSTVLQRSRAVTPAGPDPTLSAPTRNRYFYGKLLDVRHLELEQRYFVDIRRLMNRLTIGTGVVCGLHVQPAAVGGVVVQPGVAIDGMGREIIVTDPYFVADPWAVLDACDPQAPSTDGPLVLCLAYHECPIDPEPVLVSDCEVREECTPSAVRERFRICVTDHLPEHLDEKICSQLFGSAGPAPAVPGAQRVPRGELVRAPQYPQLAAMLGRDRLMTGVGAQPALDRADTLRRRLCLLLDTTCVPPTDDCVPLAIVSHTDNGVAVEECAARTTLYSNETLLDLLLCLAEKVDECCNGPTPPPPVTTAPPRVATILPAPGQSITPEEMKQLLHVDNGLGVVFEREMNTAQLKAPNDWLRAWMFVESKPGEGAGDPSQPTAGVVPLELTYQESRPGGLGGVNGFVAVYRLTTRAVTARAMRMETAFDHLDASAPPRILVQMRSDPGTPTIVDTSNPPLSLDAEYAGTGLSRATLDAIWTVDGVYALPPGSGEALELPVGTPLPPLPFSGDGAEGGVFHSWFAITLA